MAETIGRRLRLQTTFSNWFWWTKFESEWNMLHFDSNIVEICSQTDGKPLSERIVSLNINLPLRFDELNEQAVYNKHTNHTQTWFDYSWWRHQMETVSALLAICAGNSPVPVNSPHKGQWCGALMFSMIYARINSWVNNREAGNLRRHPTHCDVIVMLCSEFYRDIMPWPHNDWWM